MVSKLESRVMPLAEACRLLGISYATGQRLAASGEFPGVLRLGRQGRYLVSRAAFEAFLAGERKA